MPTIEGYDKLHYFKIRERYSGHFRLEIMERTSPESTWGVKLKTRYYPSEELAMKSGQREMRMWIPSLRKRMEGLI